MILHGNSFGEGKPFIILHGFLGMGDNWKTLARQFAEEGYEMHLVDQRNHGKSFHSDAINYELMAEDVLKYCEENNLDDIILLGHSMGGKTAMQLAVNFPEKVKKLIVADIAPKYYEPHHQTILEGLNALASNDEVLHSRGDADEFLENYIQDWGTRQFLLKNLYWEKDKKLALRINLPVLTEKVEMVGEGLDEKSTYEGPSLFLRGAKSGYIKDEDFTRIKKQFKNSEVVTIEKAGHWLHAENPKDFFKEVIKFL